MRIRFLKIAAAATSVALGAVLVAGSAFAVDEKSKVTFDPVVDLSGERAEVIAINKDYTDTYQKFYDEVLEREAAKIDDDVFAAFNEMLLNDTYSEDKDPYLVAQKKAEDEAQAKCEELGLYSVIKLTRMETDAYIGWTGTFEVDSIEDTQLYFSTPINFSCSGGNRAATIKGDAAHAGNYKRAVSTLTYANGQSSTKTVNGTSQSVSATADAKSGTIVKGSYTLVMYDGTAPGAKLMEIAYITLVKS